MKDEVRPVPAWPRRLGESLLLKLVAVNVAVLGLVVLVIWLAIDYLAADYFSTLMERYNVNPVETNSMFVSAVHRYLMEATLVALVLAVLLGFLLTRRLLRPLSAMERATRRIAGGDYAARVAEGREDEVGRLARAFNRMAGDLARTEALRRSMVVDVAHELRTPLTNMRGYLEGLADGVVPPSRETFRMLEQESLRLVRLVEDLGQLARADAARAGLRRQEVFLPILVRRVLRFYAPAFAERGIRVEVDLADDARCLRADRDRLVQVLRNLLQNAAQYTDPGGRVRVEGRRAANGVQVTVANSGVQVAPEDLPHLFERFYRADKSRSRESGGAGIGLAIVKGLVAAHGGRVGADSGGGETRVWFEVPD